MKLKQTGAADALDELLDPRDVASIVKRSTKTLEHWRHRRVGPPFIYIGKRPKYPRRDLSAWIAQQPRYAGGVQ